MFQKPEHLLQESGAYKFESSGRIIYASAATYPDSEEVAFRESSGMPTTPEEIETVRKAFWPNANDMVMLCTLPEIVPSARRLKHYDGLFNN
jgi:hypothetical protein